MEAVEYMDSWKQKRCHDNRPQHDACRDRKQNRPLEVLDGIGRYWTVLNGIGRYCQLILFNTVQYRPIPSNTVEFSVLPFAARLEYVPPSLFHDVWEKGVEVTSGWRQLSTWTLGSKNVATIIDRNTMPVGIASRIGRWKYWTVLDGIGQY